MRSDERKSLIAPPGAPDLMAEHGSWLTLSLYSSPSEVPTN
jgi:hypothetical protein